MNLIEQLVEQHIGMCLDTVADEIMDNFHDYFNRRMDNIDIDAVITRLKLRLEDENSLAIRSFEICSVQK